MCCRCLDGEFSVEKSNVYFTVIGQALQELWQACKFEKSLRIFNTFYSRSSILDHAGLRVKCACLAVSL